MNEVMPIRRPSRRRTALLAVASALIGIWIMLDATWCEAHMRPASAVVFIK